jgi:hypothetical protein
MALQRTIGNHAVRELIQRDEAEGKPKSKTLYMGMNPAAGGEVKTLKSVLKDDVITAMNDPALEKTLATDAGIAMWLINEVPSLLRNLFQFAFAYDAIQKTTPSARDQMGQVIKMFHAANEGNFSLERMVLSGHSNGVELWGDEAKNFNPGSFVLDDALSSLTSTFPKAAAQVQDVMFSACYTLSSIELVIKVFPNVRTVWAYAGASPAAGAGAEQHIARWERETRGEKTLSATDGVGKSALWTRDAAEASDDGRGYIRNDPAKIKLPQLQDSYWGLYNNARSQLLGDSPYNKSILNSAYFQLQMILAHPELKDEADRAAYNHQREVVLRFRYYDKVCQTFARTYEAQIQAAYAAMGRRTPNFASITRAALRAELHAFKAALEAKADADGQAFYDTYLEPFWKLDQTLIPSTWI